MESPAVTALRHLRLLSCRAFCRAEHGATAIEYSLIMALVFLAIVGGVAALGQGVVDVLYNKIEALL